ncbi:MAG: hypothetical protein AW08_00256 [Candidatus Accumulibacter adjunctus]|uniref:Uncharacterized protein n=1 Tax=Candidatus Accumulibacter adjunctus TaxID=1454001 RepID=A0A011MIK5_9PROT|nr:MAG: hypothetical protein AW08_00256 [Candidatus Accumulibacter adjunctus]
MISAPSEMRCRSMWATSMTAKTIAIVSGIASATTVPGRTPRLTKLHARMMTIACQSEVMKSLIAWSTVTAWSATRVVSMPTGRSATTSAITLRTLSPRARMSPASRMAIARPMAGLPLTRNIGCGGSVKPRRTLAMSPRRKMRSPATMFTASMSRSESKAPETRRNTRSCSPCIVPAGRTRFCACSVATIWLRFRRRPASRSVENSM